jgi:hypothetical protein
MSLPSVVFGDVDHKEMLNRSRALADRVFKSNGRFSLAQVLALTVLTNAWLRDPTAEYLNKVEADLLESLKDWRAIEKHQRLNNRLERLLSRADQHLVQKARRRPRRKRI